MNHKYYQKNIIAWENDIQKLLWDLEMSDQCSDDMWENSRPYDHYIVKFWVRLWHKL